ncbi:ribose-5-phosphate isomerase A [Liquorilactobacillus sicerae]|uniref:ribose-5-phosphate isomerase A n=1 Tax=Liquorilactobacillus sicerae TaxID=1416943 RepID=UPI0024800AD0|nr:ribose-5-phosphate isomerase A [Liquorilactobacillus sicerae]
MIQPGMKISLGGGSNVAQLTAAIAASNLTVDLCSPAEATRQLAYQLGLSITAQPFEKIDLAFDGCDSLDSQLNALKSNGGIHTLEKSFAARADRYLILAPLQRLKTSLDPQIPLTLEVVALNAKIIQSTAQQLGLNAKIRLAQVVAGYARTPLGNLLIDCYSANDWRQISQIEHQLSRLNGVVGTSYFEKIVTDAILFDNNEKIRILGRNNNNEKI